MKNKKELEKLHYTRTPVKISGSNSLYVNLPAKIVEELKIDRNTPLSIYSDGRSIVITPLREVNGE